jgi:uncharacterized membrane protein
MFRARSCVAAVVLLIGVRALGAQPARINTMIRPDAPIRDAAVQLVVTVDVTQLQSGASLTILAPSGFGIREIRNPAQGVGPGQGSSPNTARVSLGAVQGRVTKVFMLDPPSRSIPRGKYRLLASVAATPPNAAEETVLAQSEFDVDYVPAISLIPYLGLGLVGIVAGYLLRLLVKVLASITPPVPFTKNTGDGPITRFVKKYYYLVDCLVTLVLGLFVLLYLIKDGHVPDSAAYWYGALVTGVGLGLLTNSELITKLPR